jgi:hypothetical protein
MYGALMLTALDPDFPERFDADRAAFVSCMDTQPRATTITAAEREAWLVPRCCSACSREAARQQAEEATVMQIAAQLGATANATSQHRASQMSQGGQQAACERAAQTIVASRSTHRMNSQAVRTRLDFRHRDMERTADSIGFFDRADLHAALAAALSAVLSHVPPALAEAANGIGGFSLHKELDQWHKTHLSTSVHSMETERTLNRLGGRVWAGHVSNASTARTWAALTELSQDRIVVTEESWRESTMQAAKEAAARQAVSRQTDYMRSLQEACDAATSKAARDEAVQEERRILSAEREALALQRKEKAGRLGLFNRLRFKPARVAVLLALEGDSITAEEQYRVRELKAPELKLRLLNPKWSLAELSAAVDLAASLTAAATRDQQQQQEDAVASQHSGEGVDGDVLGD